MRWKCPNCGSEDLIVVRNEQTVTAVKDVSPTEIVYGKEEVCEVESADLRCNGCGLYPATNGQMLMAGEIGLAGVDFLSDQDPASLCQWIEKYC